MRKFSKEKDKNICDLYLEGINTKEIAKIYNTFNTSIRRVLLRNNITIRTQSDVRAIVKTNPFDDLNNAQTRYWLGYIIADGSISSTNNNRSHHYIDLSTNLDKDHLLKYIDFLQYPIKLKIYYNKKYKCNEYSVRFSSIKIWNYMQSLGITPNKSLNINITIPMTWELLHGIFDGDGHAGIINKYQMIFNIATASPYLANKIINFFKNEDIKVYLRPLLRIKCKKIYIISVYNQADQFKIFTKFYNQSSYPFLERKKDKFGPVVKKFTTCNSVNSGKASD